MSDDTGIRAYCVRDAEQIYQLTNEIDQLQSRLAAAEARVIDAVEIAARLRLERDDCRRLLRELLEAMTDGWLPEYHTTDSWVKRAAKAAGGE